MRYMCANMNPSFTPKQREASKGQCANIMQWSCVGSESGSFSSTLRPWRPATRAAERWHWHSQMLRSWWPTLEEQQIWSFWTEPVQCCRPVVTLAAQLIIIINNNNNKNNLYVTKLLFNPQKKLLQQVYIDNQNQGKCSFLFILTIFIYGLLQSRPQNPTVGRKKIQFSELNSPCVSLNLSEVCGLKQGCLGETAAQRPGRICIYYRKGTDADIRAPKCIKIIKTDGFWQTSTFKPHKKNRI